MLCIYFQSDRNKICNEVSIHFVSILLLLVFSLGLVLCLLPSNYVGNEEETVIKAINNSPGNFWISIICLIICIYIVLISISRSTLEIKIWSDHLHDQLIPMLFLGHVLGLNDSTTKSTECNGEWNHIEINNIWKHIKHRYFPLHASS